MELRLRSGFVSYGQDTWRESRCSAVTARSGMSQLRRRSDLTATVGLRYCRRNFGVWYLRRRCRGVRTTKRLSKLSTVGHGQVKPSQGRTWYRPRYGNDVVWYGILRYRYRSEAAKVIEWLRKRASAVGSGSGDKCFVVFGFRTMTDKDEMVCYFVTVRYWAGSAKAQFICADAQFLVVRGRTTVGRRRCYERNCNGEQAQAFDIS